MTTIPFDGPTLLTAKRISGFVDIPENKNAEESPMGNWGNGNVSFTPDDAVGGKSEDQERMAGPTYLKRTSTMAGNIVVIDIEGQESQAFWLQRKVGQTAHGSIRLGFVLRYSETESADSEGAAGRVWELAPGPATEGDAGIDYQMVAIKILDTAVLNSDHAADSLLHNPVNELCALQMVAKHYEKKGKTGHVVATKLIAVSSQHVYAILPYYPDGTLFQFCLSQESLKEPVARFFFRQILQVSSDVKLVSNHNFAKNRCPDPVCIWLLVGYRDSANGRVMSSKPIIGDHRDGWRSNLYL